DATPSGQAVRRRSPAKRRRKKGTRANSATPNRPPMMPATIIMRGPLPGAAPPRLGPPGGARPRPLPTRYHRARGASCPAAAARGGGRLQQRAEHPGEVLGPAAEPAALAPGVQVQLRRLRQVARLAGAELGVHPEVVEEQVQLEIEVERADVEVRRAEDA